MKSDCERKSECSESGGGAEQARTAAATAAVVEQERTPVTVDEYKQILCVDAGKFSHCSWAEMAECTGAAHVLHGMLIGSVSPY